MIKRAFTLIELLVVIVIIAVMAAAVLPAYGRFLDKTRFENEVREVRDLCAHARDRAVARDTIVSLSFDAATQAFAVIVPTLPPPSDQPVAFGSTLEAQIAMNPTEPPRGYTLPSNVMVSDFMAGGTGGSTGRGTSAIRFRSDGGCDAAQFRLVSETGYIGQITLIPVTGQVKYEDQSP